MPDPHKKFLDENFDIARENFFEAKRSVLKALLVVTTGTFVLSISFLTAFSDKHFVYGWALMLSWLCMAISIGTFIAFSHHDAEAEASIMDELRTLMPTNNPLPHGYTPGQTDRTLNFYTRANGFMNLTYMLAGLGIGLLLFFGIVNFAAQQALQDKNYTEAYGGYLLLKYQ